MVGIKRFLFLALATGVLSSFATDHDGHGEPERLVDPPKVPPPTEEAPHFAYPPTAPAKPAGREAEFKDQEFFWFNDNNGRVQWDDPTLIRVDDQGLETYIDAKTGASTKVKPAEAAWLSEWSEEHQMEFFHNTITKESTWDLPDQFAWHQVYFDEHGAVIAEPEEEEGEWEWSEEDDTFASGEDGQLHEDGYAQDNHLEEEAEAEILRKEGLADEA